MNSRFDLLGQHFLSFFEGAAKVGDEFLSGGIDNVLSRGCRGGFWSESAGHIESGELASAGGVDELDLGDIQCVIGGGQSQRLAVVAIELTLGEVELTAGFLVDNKTFHLGELADFDDAAGFCAEGFVDGERLIIECDCVCHIFVSVSCVSISRDCRRPWIATHWKRMGAGQVRF